MIKELVYQEDAIRESNIRASKYMEQNLVKQKGKINIPTVKMEDFNTPLLAISRKIGKKSLKSIE